MRIPRLILGSVVVVVAAAACAQPQSASSAARSDDAIFQQVADEYLADYFKRHPTGATYLGIHDYDSQLEDASKAGVQADIATLKRFRDRFAAINEGGLSLANQLDRAQVLAAIDSQLLERAVIRSWARNPDGYSSGLGATAYIMIKRAFAPASDRLRAL